MKRTKNLIILFLFTISFLVNGQDIDKKTVNLLRVKMFSSEELYNDGNYGKALEKIKEFESLAKDNFSAKIQDIKIKCLIRLERYNEANSELIFFEEVGIPKSFIKGILSYETQIKEGIKNIKDQKTREIETRKATKKRKNLIQKRKNIWERTKSISEEAYSDFLRESYKKDFKRGIFKIKGRWHSLDLKSVNLSFFDDEGKLMVKRKSNYSFNILGNDNVIRFYFMMEERVCDITDISENDLKNSLVHNVSLVTIKNCSCTETKEIIKEASNIPRRYEKYINLKNKMSVNSISLFASNFSFQESMDKHKKRLLEFIKLSKEIYSINKIE